MKILFISFTIFFYSISAIGSNKKVKLNINQEEVYVILNRKMIGLSPNYIKIDFDLGGTLYFFKKGYLSHSVEIDPNNVYDKLAVDLTKKSKSEPFNNAPLLDFVEYTSDEIVTNMSERDVKTEIEDVFLDRNVNIGKNSIKFPNGELDVKSSRYILRAELLSKKQISQVYKSPKFLMANIYMRWTIAERSTNKVVLIKENEGMFFVRLQSIRGIVVNDRLLSVTKEAIEESVLKLLDSDEFEKIFR